MSAAGEVTLAMRDLAPTSGDQVYEAWVIGGDGVPVPLGGFTVGQQPARPYFEGSGLPADGRASCSRSRSSRDPGATTPDAADHLERASADAPPG